MYCIFTWNLQKWESLNLAWDYFCCTPRKADVSLQLCVSRKAAAELLISHFRTVKYTYKDGGLISPWRGLEGEAFVLLGSRPSHREAHALWHSLLAGRSNGCVSEVRHSLVAELPRQARGKVAGRGGKLKSTYSRWTLLSTKGTEGDAFCPHARYFTKLQEERRAQFNWELGESAFQLYCS